MNLVIAKTDIHPEVDKYMNLIREKAKAETEAYAFSNPIQTKLYSFKRESKQYNILTIKAKLLPAYYLLFVSIALFFMFPNWFTGIISCVFGIISIPFTNLFWILTYKYGLRKQGYKGKVTFLRSNTAWGDYIWGK